MRWIGCGVLGALLATAPGARGEVVELAFSGQVDFVSDPFGSFPGVAPGSAFEGTVRFDSEAPDRDDRTTFGLYLFGTAPFGLEVDIDGLTLRTNPDSPALAIETANDFPFQGEPADRYGVLSDEFGPVRIEIQLLDLDATALADDALPLDPPDLQAFEFRVFEVLDLRDGSTLGGSVERLERVPEPHPGTGLLLLAGVLTARTRRRRAPAPR